MLTEERFARILKVLEEKKAATVTELAEILDVSESTIRRDLTMLNDMGKLNKVHGGATLPLGIYTLEEDVSVKYSLNTEEKSKIGKYAAGLIRPNDFIYIDAGTTTEAMAEHISEKTAVYVTNGISLAGKLVRRGFQVYVISGRIKSSTEAIVGTEALKSLEKYHFTAGFFGTNGISVSGGFSTPDVDEAGIKREAMSRCKKNYILADSSKFDKVSSVTFALISQAEIITSILADIKYKNYTLITEVDGK
ncbi:MAG: DeoR/GlpR family DNA-binding transcription regulator [Oscillospiraceae bacterium]|nr:DeoR/GlpR family DNA-binding transcription regulator [Oscillospiraceae bacterium]